MQFEREYQKRTVAAPSGLVMTLDGPSGVGKTTISTLLAQILGYHLLRSGLFYRALAYLARQEEHVIGVPSEQQCITWIPHMQQLTFLSSNDVIQVLWQKVDVTQALQDPSCGQMASQLAVYPKLREQLLPLQRSFHQPPGLIAEGRDMGTCVFPNADFKVFMTANLRQRALRRFLQLSQQGREVDLSEIETQLAERDAQDTERDVAPLQAAHDAIILDTSEKKAKDVVEDILKRFQDRD